MAIPRLTRYALLKSLAVGGMGEVFLAKQRSNIKGFERVVAVKLLLRSYSDDPGFISMFFNEASVVAKLNHPNIVQVFDLDHEEDLYYIAMEYLAGESLQRILSLMRERNSWVPARLACDVFGALAEALHYAHGMGLIHRDVTPSNVMFCDQGVVKLIDFGIARAANEFSNEKTSPGTIKGKFGYMAPEYLSGKEYDHRADVYSLGVVMWEALTGRRLFGGKTQVELIQLVLAGVKQNLAVANPAIPTVLSKVVMKALERDPNKRFASAKDLSDALRTASGDIPSEKAFLSLQRWMEHIFGPEIKAREELIKRVLDTPLLPPVAPTATGGFPEISVVTEGGEVSLGEASVKGQKVTQTWVKSVVVAARQHVALTAAVGVALLGGTGYLLARSGHAPPTVQTASGGGEGHVAAPQPQAAPPPAAAPVPPAAPSLAAGHATPPLAGRPVAAAPPVAGQRVFLRRGKGGKWITPPPVAAPVAPPPVAPAAAPAPPVHAEPAEPADIAPVTPKAPRRAIDTNNPYGE